jgi:hypothetical protein
MLGTVLSSPIGDGATKATLVMARCRCRVMLATVLPSHPSDGAAKVTWPRRDVSAESCWRQCFRGILAMA